MHDLRKRARDEQHSVWRALQAASDPNSSCEQLHVVVLQKRNNAAENAHVAQIAIATRNKWRKRKADGTHSPPAVFLKANALQRARCIGLQFDVAVLACVTTA